MWWAQGLVVASLFERSRRLARESPVHVSGWAIARFDRCARRIYGSGDLVDWMGAGGTDLELCGLPGGELLVVHLIRRLRHLAAYRLYRLDVFSTVAFDSPRRLFERQNVRDEALDEPIGNGDLRVAPERDRRALVAPAKPPGQDGNPHRSRDAGRIALGEEETAFRSFEGPSSRKTRLSTLFDPPPPLSLSASAPP